MERMLRDIWTIFMSLLAFGSCVQRRLQSQGQEAARVAFCSRINSLDDGSINKSGTIGSSGNALNLMPAYKVY